MVRAYTYIKIWIITTMINNNSDALKVYAVLPTLQIVWGFCIPPFSTAVLISPKVTYFLSQHFLSASNSISSISFFLSIAKSYMSSHSFHDIPRKMTSLRTSSIMYSNVSRRKSRSVGLCFKNSSSVTRSKETTCLTVHIQKYISIWKDFTHTYLYWLK